MSKYPAMEPLPLEEWMSADLRLDISDVNRSIEDFLSRRAAAVAGPAGEARELTLLDLYCALVRALAAAPRDRQHHHLASMEATHEAIRNRLAREGVSPDGEPFDEQLALAVEEWTLRLVVLDRVLDRALAQASAHSAAAGDEWQLRVNANLETALLLQRQYHVLYRRLVQPFVA